MVFHRGLAAGRDQNDLGTAGGDGLFDAVLDQRLVDQAEHLLRGGFGSGEESRSHASGGEDCFTNFLECHGADHLSRVWFACENNRNKRRLPDEGRLGEWGMAILGDALRWRIEEDGSLRDYLLVALMLRRMDTEASDSYSGSGLG